MSAYVGLESFSKKNPLRQADQNRQTHVQKHSEKDKHFFVNQLR